MKVLALLNWATPGSGMSPAAIFVFINRPAHIVSQIFYVFTRMLRTFMPASSQSLHDSHVLSLIKLGKQLWPALIKIKCFSHYVPFP